jgi:hypothetical protein
MFSRVNVLSHIQKRRTTGGRSRTTGGAAPGVERPSVQHASTRKLRQLGLIRPMEPRRKIARFALLPMAIRFECVRVENQETYMSPIVEWTSIMGWAEVERRILLPSLNATLYSDLEDTKHSDGDLWHQGSLGTVILDDPPSASSPRNLPV